MGRPDCAEEQTGRRCEPCISLPRALEIKDGDVVSFVGAGGKSSLMLRLAAELTGTGKSVLLTTTTKMWRHQLSDADGLLVTEDFGPVLTGLRLESGSLWAIGRRVDGNGKLLGIPEEWVDTFRKLDNVSNVLVEADGAAGRSLKAPGKHEPVIPPCSKLVVVVAGMDVLGKPLSPEHIHRAEIASRLLGIPMNATVTPEVIAGILCHPSGGAKGCPEGARLHFVLNKVDDRDDLNAARVVAAEVLRRRPAQVTLTSCRSPQTVVETLSVGSIAG